MREKKKYLEGTAEILRLSQKEKKKYKIEILGEKFVVYPNVFSPKYFKDTEFFAKEMPIKKGEKFLEIGCGTGVISIFAVLKGASKVQAVDINLNAVKNTKENVKLHKMEKRVMILHGDLFQPIKKGTKFYSIFWNTPFGYVKRKKLSTLEKSIFDSEYKSTKKFINQAKNYLKLKGRLLIGFSSTLGHLALLKGLLKKENYKIKLLKEKKSKEKYPVKFQLYEAIRLK